jgi:hypothetical protein
MVPSSIVSEMILGQYFMLDQSLLIFTPFQSPVALPDLILIEVRKMKATMINSRHLGTEPLNFV